MRKIGNLETPEQYASEIPAFAAMTVGWFGNEHAADYSAATASPVHSLTTSSSAGRGRSAGGSAGVPI